MAARVGRFTVVEAGDGEAEDLFRRAQEAAAGLAGHPAVVHAKAWRGFPFASAGSGPPDLRLVALSALGPDRASLAGAWAPEAGGLLGVARFDVELEPVRVTGTGWGVEIVPGAPPRPDEPVLAVITGDLHPGGVEPFTAAVPAAAAQAAAAPGYLGGCGLLSTGRDITSLSCWRSSKDARTYAVGRGPHRQAIADDLAGGWHDLATLLFATFRVLASSGTLLGATPFAG